LRRLAGLSNSLFQDHGYGVTDIFAEELAQFGLDGEFMRAIAERHERALKPMAVDGASDFNVTAGFEERS
jgi:hypothetical protein